MVVWTTYINQLYYQMYWSQLCQNTVYWSLHMKQCDSFLHKCMACVFSVFFFFFNAYSHSKVSLLFNTFTYIVTNHCFFFFFPLITNLFLSSRLGLYRKRNFKTIIKNSIYHTVKKISTWCFKCILIFKGYVV